MMPPVPVSLPRWEWRTFAASLRGLRRRLGAGLPRPARDELHLLCLSSAHHACIREGILQLRWRKQVDGEGAELWDPILASAFPLSRAVVERLFHAWALPVPAGLPRECGLPLLLDEIVAPCSDLRALATRTAWEECSLDGVPCIFARIRGDEVRVDSFALEHEDPALIASALRSLGLDTHPNTSVPLGLKRALGLVPA